MLTAEVQKGMRDRDTIIFEEASAHARRLIMVEHSNVTLYNY